MLEVGEKTKEGKEGGGRAPGTEGARRATGVTGGSGSAKGGRAGPEVSEKAQRRRYSAEYKLGILEAVDACTEPGEIGALLRREGLYSSLLSTWREQRRCGTLNGLTPRKRGRKPVRSAEAKRVEQLERENRRLREELRQAQLIIDVQKKVARLLGNPIEGDDEDVS